MKKKIILWGIMIQTDTHGEDVDAAAADDDQIAFVVFACHKTFFCLLCEIVFAMTTKPDKHVVQYFAVRTSLVMYVDLCLVIV